jgi:arsenite methyltransferase
MSERMIIDDVRDQYAGVAKGTLIQRIDGGQVDRIGVRLLGRRTESIACRSQHGIVVRQPIGIGRHSRRRSRRGPWMRRWHGCVSGCSQSGLIGPSHRYRHDTEMLERARAGQQKLGLTNVEFHQSTIDALPLPITQSTV